MLDSLTDLGKYNMLQWFLGRHKIELCTGQNCVEKSPKKSWSNVVFAHFDHGDQTVHLRGKIIGWARMRAASEPVPVLHAKDTLLNSKVSLCMLSVIEFDCWLLFLFWLLVYLLNSEWKFTAISKSIWYWRGRNAPQGTPGGIYQVSIFDSLSNVSSLRQIRKLIPVFMCVILVKLKLFCNKAVHRADGSGARTAVQSLGLSCLWPCTYHIIFAKSLCIR